MLTRNTRKGVREVLHEEILIDQLRSLLGDHLHVNWLFCSILMAQVFGIQNNDSPSGPVSMRSQVELFSRAVLLFGK